MDNELHSTRSSSRTFLSLARKKGASGVGGEFSDDKKGPLGLNTLYVPLRGTANADIIFVHGLGGGSLSTWTKLGDYSLYWPKEWLPNDPAFQDARIHSFGYDSNWTRESVLGITDFANALVGSIIDCPMMPHDTRTPIIMIGHSMGGLVIKRALLLAKLKEESSVLSSRIQAIFFLATPHRGSDLAQTLSKILTLNGAPRPFVNDLHRNSLAIQSINEEFPHHCKDIQLYSFYETISTNFGIKKSLVVEKDLAVMGYANERREYLHANHREVCKFSSQDEPNYQKVRNALASLLDSLRNRFMLSKQTTRSQQIHLLNNCLGVQDNPEDDFMSADSLRMVGSGEWLINKISFQEWLNSIISPIYCITAKPATGKTVLSGKVIAHLKSLEKNCSFYFFQHGNEEKSTIASFLLSMAWQMALSDERILAAYLTNDYNGSKLGRADYRTIWRKLFVDGIFKIQSDQVHFWVIDALDECKAEVDIVSLLIKAVEECPIRIFITSRNQFESSQKLGANDGQIFSDTILEENSKSDIALYLNANMSMIPSLNENGRQHIADQILQKSRGCFLWVTVVFKELKNVHTSMDVQKILDEVPFDMNELFARILDSMSRASYGKSLVKAILTWTICSTRPLKTFELHDALQLDLQDTIDNVKESIQSCCGQLVYVDTKSQVQMIHLTARDFLFQSTTKSEFAIDEKKGHRRLLLTCLNYLNSDDMRDPRRRRPQAGGGPKERSAFASYACDSMFEHINHVSWTDQDIVSILARFFRSPNVLSWIEYIAENSDLNRLIQTGNALKNFLQGSYDHSSSPTKELILLDSWATDLVRLVMKFGSNLEAYPSSIYRLISPFCPLATAPRKQFGSTARSISVRGLRAETWDDCLSTIANTYDEQYLSLACSKANFAIGCFSGTIFIFKDSTCQEVAVLRHEEPVRFLTFGNKKSILVSVGSKFIRVWDLNSQKQVQMFDAFQQCMTLILVDGDQILIGAMKDHHLKSWDLCNGDLMEDVDWTLGLEDMTGSFHRRPITAAFSMDTERLAIIYKGQDILLWDLQGASLYDIYSREAGRSGSSGRPYGSAGVRCLIFGTGVTADLLASAYSDGELVIFDTSIGEVKKKVVAFAHVLACSPDGSILATADPSGTIQMFKFESMHLIYRINSIEPGIRSLAFSGDGLRLLDIRASRCRVWSPPVLVAQNADEHRDSSPYPTAPLEISLESSDNAVLITSIACHESGGVLFCGKEDGSVYLYTTESGLQSQRLFSHANGVSIISLSFQESSCTLSSIDSSSRIMIHKLSHENLTMAAPEVLFDHRVGTAVQQLVCAPNLNYVLVCSTDSDNLWLISPNENILLATITYEDREPYRWISHPSNPEHLVLITHNLAHIYEWKTLERLTESEGIILEARIPPGLSIRSVTYCFKGTVIATMFSASNRPHSKSKLLLWNTSDFSSNSKAISPISAYSSLADRVEFLIGTFQNGPKQVERMIFLHDGNWVCSTDSEMAKENYAMRHFFFPIDWLSTNLELIVEITKKGDIILVKRDEVVVVRNGLLANEFMKESLGGLGVKTTIPLRSSNALTPAPETSLPSR